MNQELITHPLLSWYKAHHRPLPWRENVHPYTTWVSEIMAQQTRIAQLLPFYERFMSLFPDVLTLAAAHLDEVLTAWAGMGYYARARNLHAAAQRIAREGWPSNKAEWLTMPGVGEYTAGAIASIVNGERVTAIDGNALRVYARLANDPTDISTPAAKISAADFFSSAMPESNEGMRIYNQAIMELGALICTPLQPACASCQLQSVCLAYRHDRVQCLPVKKRKKTSPVIPITVFMVIDPSGRVLTTRREEGVLKGMSLYCLHEGKMHPEASLSIFGLTVLSVKPIGHARHVFTHRVWEMEGYRVDIAKTQAPEGYRFMSKDEIKTAPFPAAVKYFTEWFLNIKI